MLITIIGDDYQKSSKKTKEIITWLETKKPNAIFTHYDFLDLDEKKMNESIETIGGLFEEKNIFWFSNIFHNKKIKNLFFENLEKISSSENAFILTENFVTETEFKKLEKNSFKTERFILPKNEFNIFSISDSIQKKDIKNSWLKYNLGLKNGIVVEKIYGNIFFALKSLLLAKKFSEKQSGMKNFSYKKAGGALCQWKEKEVEEKFLELILIYNQSRLSGLPLKENLEKFILNL